MIMCTLSPFSSIAVLTEPERQQDRARVAPSRVRPPGLPMRDEASKRDIGSTLYN